MDARDLGDQALPPLAGPKEAPATSACGDLGSHLVPPLHIDVHWIQACVRRVLDVQQDQRGRLRNSRGLRDLRGLLGLLLLLIPHLFGGLPGDEADHDGREAVEEQACRHDGRDTAPRQRSLLRVQAVRPRKLAGDAEADGLNEEEGDGDGGDLFLGLLSLIVPILVHLKVEVLAVACAEPVGEAEQAEEEAHEEYRDQDGAGRELREDLQGLYVHAKVYARKGRDVREEDGPRLGDPLAPLLGRLLHAQGPPQLQLGDHRRRLVRGHAQGPGGSGGLSLGPVRTDLREDETVHHGEERQEHAQAEGRVGHRYPA
mmetsp:Transcript_138783/g.431728  ORF Transcript_138783/g.431728 Transcript_138783/m.431728 type:complete len:315 (-) Transcript_138783:251-1195(-)